MVFVHGGGGFMGAAPPYSESSAFARHRTILVTVQYRLGALGWWAHPLLSAEQGGTSGNYAVMDMLAALAWVRRRIGAFGGDAKRVMVFGQSFGGSAIHQLLLTPLARGLFSAAVVHSAGLDLHFPAQQTVEAGAGAALLAGLNCTSLACARGRAWEVVMDGAHGEMVAPNVNGRIAGAAFPLQPLAAIRAGRVNGVPAIFGHNAQEDAIGDYFSARPFADFATALASEAAVEAHVARLLNATAPPPCSVAEAARKARALLAEHYPVAGVDGYTRWQSVRSDAGVALGAWIWAREWAAADFSSRLYVYAGRAVGAPRMAPFGAMHLLDLTLLFNATGMIDRQGSAFSPSEASTGEQMAAQWTRMAATGAPDARWAMCCDGPPNRTQAMVFSADGGAALGTWHGDVVLSQLAPWEGYGFL